MWSSYSYLADSYYRRGVVLSGYVVVAVGSRVAVSVLPSMTFGVGKL